MENNLILIYPDEGCMLFRTDLMPQVVQARMWSLACMSLSVIACLYLRINEVHVNAKLFDDLLACRPRYSAYPL